MSSSVELNWFAEAPISGFQQRVQVVGVVYEGKSSFQDVAIYDTVPFARSLVLERAVQTTLNDEFIYHEMLVHPAHLAHQNPKRTLIIGGGDGGTLRRVLEHGVEHATMVEIDRDVVDVCRRYMPEIASGALDDERADVHIDDGIRFVAETSERFDVMLIDSTDPIGPAKALFDVEFYRHAHRILAPDGLLVTQSGSPLLMRDELIAAQHNLRAIFPSVACYTANIPSYPGCLWSFLIAAKDAKMASSFVPDSPYRASVITRFDQLGLKTRYYTPQVHFASFALPQFLADALGGNPA